LFCCLFHFKKIENYKIFLNQFSRSFTTTNCIESLNSQVGKFIGKVKLWQTPDQRLRWIAIGLLEAELKKKKVSGFEKLPQTSQNIKNNNK
jgi:transposase-like protein